MGLFDLFRKKDSREKQSAFNQVTKPVITTQIQENDIDQVYNKRFQGLTIGEIILLDWLNGKEETREAPGYFAYTYGINWLNSKKMLIRQNFLRIGTPSEGLSTLKVAELKIILKENNLGVSGKKKDLIDRIKTNVQESKYSSKILKTYVLTDKGNKYLEQYEIFVWAHKNGSKTGTVNPITMAPFLGSNESFENIALHLSENEFKSYFYNYSYGMASNELSYQILLKSKQGKDEESLTLILIQTLLDFTGVGNINSPNYIYLFPDPQLAFILKEKIISLQFKLNLSTAEIVKLASDIYDTYEPKLIKIRLYKNKKEYLSGLVTLINENNKLFTDLFDKWYQRLPNKYKTEAHRY